MKRIFKLFILLIAIVALFSCGKDNSLEKLRKNELELLDAFIQENYPDSLPRPSGLYYIEEFEGNGDSLIVPGDKVQVFYAKWTVDSTLLDETSGYTAGYRFEPYEFIVGAGTAIAGLEEAATYMQKGTIASLVIPSELAYGQNGTYGIPAFTTLLMHVEVYKIYRGNTSSQ